MLAFIGFAAQYLATGKGPLDNLAVSAAGECAAACCTALRAFLLLSLRAGSRVHG
jgi:hypothetical protein